MHMLWQMHTARSAISILLPRRLLIRVTAEEVVSKLRFGGWEGKRTRTRGKGAKWG